MKQVYAPPIRQTAAAFAIALLSTTPVVAATETTDDTISIEDIRADIGKTFDTIAEYSADQRDEAVASAERALADADAAIERVENNIRNNWHDMSQDVKKHSRDSLHALRRERTELAVEFGALKSGADDAWDDLVDGFTDAWDEFETAWENTDKPENNTD